ncbi:hypothetical protein U0039_14280 [Stenotrophomonas maltophilia]|uniref:hypothetical protein n=1 Tax=Stenotrophomonas maltophilia TaxID=40324 RepID=UPI000469B9F2|nr:hypothetical protein [Stenotrophomonas maltophilia]OMP37964.1 hypothetical protein BMR86_20690 [Stenotrophomonas sp. KAs 5-3]AIL10316.1 hypothetical protein DP16_3254 [Stenotrophomonas maltophilia]OOD04878.1 hypothetical protein BWP19_21650 [Stenotrophomonas maltophilia]WQE22096.1 hypothetical protein U0039_14280 [Stenotrophomonas maltophilia]SNW11044.1 Uncharacterised protein [Stenotrophomonas maltophilia]
MNMINSASQPPFRSLKLAASQAHDDLDTIAGALNGLRDALEVRGGNDAINRDNLAMLFHATEARNLPEGVSDEGIGEARAAIIDLISPESNLNGISRARVWSLVCLLAKLQEVAVHRLGEIVHGHPALDA